MHTIQFQEKSFHDGSPCYVLVVTVDVNDFEHISAAWKYVTQFVDTANEWCTENFGSEFDEKDKPARWGHVHFMERAEYMFEDRGDALQFKLRFA